MKAIERINPELREKLSTHGTFFTVTAVFLIVALGITIVDSPDKWWIALLVVVGLAVVSFLLINMRVVIKTTIAHIILLVQAAWSFRIGAALRPDDMTASLWMISPFCVFYTCLAISYYFPVLRSRWFSVSFTTLMSFVLVSTLMVIDLATLIVFSVSYLVSVALFYFFYTYLGGKVRNRKHMPSLSFSDQDLEDLRASASGYGWGSARATEKSVIVWDDQRAYVLSKVSLDTKFGQGGTRRKQFLTYKTKDISSWVVNIEQTLRPQWRTRSAPALVVLLDEGNVNGTSSKVIGIQIPDSKVRVPVVVHPFKAQSSSKNYTKLLFDINKEYSSVLPTLNDKQLHALDMRLPASSDKNLGNVES